MNIAIINGKRTTAFSGGKAACPFCDAPVIAKCGSRRVHHWAHKGRKSCNLGKENETEWHRSWKNKFPPEFQEFIQYDQSGEKHIADVRINHGLVIEFQHSHLDPKERDIRERFYKNMVWVVDGTRLGGDYPRFQKGIGGLTTTKRNGKILVRYPEKCFPVDWLNSLVPVFFDFLGVVLTDAQDAQRQHLWCLHPNREDGNAVVTEMSRESFVEIATKGPQVQHAPVPQAVTNEILRVPMMTIDPRFLKDLSRLIPGLIKRPPRRGSWRL